ncbi:MAG: helix-turn-helix domain-containing protein [Chloroflexi bacterium]|uniref:Helix-turn-helix domain-containing protein n=1 Tax=Candidatus Chlorohelix allophototropha TaxID=3003348 RepID=A0A8T7M4A8_9CHLR|nr:helix-turn-helix domain-containing protein [Chloroflexota bacterium]WJW70086.1 helix-turn-helix domain-containing protein [Chloroflexota bacterium L227-S17]
MTNELLTIDQLAEYLQLNKNTVYRLAQDHKIPAIKIGRVWRFQKELIDRWLDSKLQGVTLQPKP